MEAGKLRILDRMSGELTHCMIEMIEVEEAFGFLEHLDHCESVGRFALMPTMRRP